MSWVTIDSEECNGCGLCAIRCPRNYRNENRHIEVTTGAETCNLCGHCVSLCPTGAITHHELDMSNFLPVDRRVRFDPEDFAQFVRARRSHRHFKDRKIPRADLEALVEMCRYTPTGSNRQTLEIVVVQDEAKIAELSDLTVEFFAKSLRDVERRVEALEAAGREIPEELQAQHARATLMQGLVQARDAGLDPILYRAPAVMIFHSPRLTSTPKDDCVIAAQTVVLAAMTRSLGTCYIGLLEAAARADSRIHEALRLPEDHRIGSVLVLGYPKLTFLRTVDRFPMKVRWE